MGRRGGRALIGLRSLKLHQRGCVGATPLLPHVGLGMTQRLFEGGAVDWQIHGCTCRFAQNLRTYAPGARHTNTVVAKCPAALSIRGGLEQRVELSHQILFQRASPSRVCVLLLVQRGLGPVGGACSERLRKLQLVLKGLPLCKSDSFGLRAMPSLPKLGLGVSQ